MEGRGKREEGSRKRGNEETRKRGRASGYLFPGRAREQGIWKGGRASGYLFPGRAREQGIWKGGRASGYLFPGRAREQGIWKGGRASRYLFPGRAREQGNKGFSPRTILTLFDKKRFQLPRERGYIIDFSGRRALWCRPYL